MSDFGYQPKEEFFLECTMAIKRKFPERDNCAIVVDVMELWEAMVAACGPEDDAGPVGSGERDEPEEPDDGQRH